MIILGIDPGTARTGWGIIRKVESAKFPPKARLARGGKVQSSEKMVGVEYVAHGCIVTPKDLEMGKRLLMLRKELRKIIKTYNPAAVVIERIFFGRNLLTATTVGQAKGVLLLTIAEYKLPVFEYTGLSAKLLLTGDGRADKKVVQKAVRKILNTTRRHLPFSTKDRGFDDAADGLAMAIYHVYGKKT